MSRKALLIAGIVVAAGGGVIAWLILSRPALPPGFAGANGRLEAQQIDISTKFAGRIAEVLAREGDTVDAGQVVATMDVEALRAQLRQAEAQIREAGDNRRTAQADVSVKQSELAFADRQNRRSKDLVVRGAVSEQEAELDRTRFEMARSSLLGSQAQAVRTQSAIDAATADAERLKADINESVLRAPVRGRIQHRLAEPGEVLASGGRVLSMVDLSDVYMYVFFPTLVVGRLAVGREARIVLDALADYPIRATVSFRFTECPIYPENGRDGAGASQPDFPGQAPA